MGELRTPGRVVILTGPPGSGKSTVARLLATRATASVHLHADDFWRYVVAGRVEPWLPEADAQNRTVVDIVALAAAGYAVAGYEVVLDGIVGPWFLQRVLAVLGERVLEAHYVVLRPAREVALARALARESGLTDADAVGAMYAQFADLGDDERCVLDTSVQSPEQTADAVAGALASGALRVSASGSGPVRAV